MPRGGSAQRPRKGCEVPQQPWPSDQTSVRRLRRSQHLCSTLPRSSRPCHSPRQIPGPWPAAAPVANLRCGSIRRQRDRSAAARGHGESSAKAGPRRWGPTSLERERTVHWTPKHPPVLGMWRQLVGGMHPSRASRWPHTVQTRLRPSTAYHRACCSCRQMSNGLRWRSRLFEAQQRYDSRQQPFAGRRRRCSVDNSPPAAPLPSVA